MADPSKPRYSWDTSWDVAISYYSQFDGDALEPMHQLVSVLASAEDVQGLFAVTSVTDLVISPYSKYPDWFDGRHVRVVPQGGSQVTIQYQSVGVHSAAAQETATVKYEDAFDLITRICREML